MEKLKMSRLVMIVLIVAVFTNCKKNNNFRPGTSTGTAYSQNSVKDYILSLGYSESDIVEVKDYFIVERDILFPKDMKIEKQASSHNLVSHINVGLMTVYVDPSIPMTGPDNWRPAISEALGQMNNIGRTKVFFLETPSFSVADIVIKADGGILEVNVAGSAMYPSGGKPGNQLLINLDFNFNQTLSELTKKYVIVHELGHCIGLRHTNWQQNGEQAGSLGANHISGTSSTDGISIMNSWIVFNSWGSFTSDDILAIRTLYPTDWKYSSQGISNWINLANAQINVSELRFGDFNGDGKTDVFHKSGSQWRYSESGTSNWINLGLSSVPLSELRFGDFNGDGVTDVFHKSGNQWRYSAGGTSNWINLGLSSALMDDLAFGDYNGDGVTDVFNKNGSQWRYSAGGIGIWINLGLSATPLSDLRFGDFNGDGVTDVFQKNGSQWRYSAGGISNWINLGLSSTPLNELRFEDFNGDGVTDVFHKNGNQWRYSAGGTSDWINLGLSSAGLNELRFGDFDGDGKADVFYSYFYP